MIVCEGEKTEPLYFKALVARLGLTTAEVEVCGECGSAPKSVVRFGKKKFDCDPDFDLIFFVFDRDSHPDYDDAIRLVQQFQLQRKLKGKTVAAITSNPCFEVWFMLHFEAFRKPCAVGGGKSPCGNLISLLKRKPEFGDYEKGQGNHFEILYSRLPKARLNAALTLQQSREIGDREHHGNPTTFVHLLIDELEGVAATYKRYGEITEEQKKAKTAHPHVKA